MPLVEKFIVVTGAPRSGTSLMMQTLDKLGVPVWGQAQPRFGRLRRFLAGSRQRRRLERTRDLNPCGYYETPLVSRGLDKPRLLEQEQQALAQAGGHRRFLRQASLIEEFESHDGAAVKIIAWALPRCHPAHFGKIILCLRNPVHVAYSQTSLDTFLSAAGPDNRWVPPRGAPSPERYIAAMGALAAFFDQNRWLYRRIQVVDYEQAHQQPDSYVGGIVEFLGLECSAQQIAAARNNINPLLRRSADAPRPAESVHWRMAEEIYRSLLAMELEVLVERLHAYQQSQALENRVFLEPETWFFMRASFARRLASEPALRRRLIADGKARRRAHWTCDCCPYFNRDGQAYTVELPADLTSPMRNKVACSLLGRDVTLEQCQNHYNQARDSLRASPPCGSGPVQDQRIGVGDGP